MRAELCSNVTVTGVCRTMGNANKKRIDKNTHVYTMDSGCIHNLMSERERMHISQPISEFINNLANNVYRALL